MSAWPTNSRRWATSSTGTDSRSDRDGSNLKELAGRPGGLTENRSDRGFADAEILLKGPQDGGQTTDGHALEPRWIVEPFAEMSGSPKLRHGRNSGIKLGKWPSGQ